MKTEACPSGTSSTRCFTPLMECRSEAYALNRPPIGIAPYLSHTRPDACVKLSVMREKYTRFSKSVCCILKKAVGRAFPSFVQVFVVAVDAPYRVYHGPSVSFLKPRHCLGEGFHHCLGSLSGVVCC